MSGKGRRGMQVIGNTPSGKQIIFKSKRAAARAIGCSEARISDLIKHDVPIRIHLEFYWLDYLFEFDD